MNGVIIAFSLFQEMRMSRLPLKPLEKKETDFRYQNWLQMPVNSGVWL